jgi:hypothetical protein
MQLSAVANQLKKEVKKQVKDRTRRDKALLLIDDMFLSKAKYAKEFFRVQNLLLSNPDLTRKEANAMAADFAKVRIDTLREGAALKIQMREHVTEQEWTAIFKKMKKKKKKGKAEPTDDTEPAPKKAESEV